MVQKKFCFIEFVSATDSDSEYIFLTLESIVVRPNPMIVKLKLNIQSKVDK